MPPKVKMVPNENSLSKSAKEAYNNLTESAKERYKEAMSFLTIDNVKSLGKSASIGILSLILIGGIAATGSKIYKDITVKNELTHMVDLVMDNDKKVYKIDQERHTLVSTLAPLIIQLLSKKGGEFSKSYYTNKNTTGMGYKKPPPKIINTIEQGDIKKSTVDAISKKIQAFIKKNKLAVASSATAATALAITIGYVLITGSGHGYLMGQSDAIINETKKFIDKNGQYLINYFTQMGSTNKASISQFVKLALATMGNIYYRGRGMEGGDLEKKDPKTFADRAKSTIKYVGQSIYDAVVSETGQAIGQGLLLTLILAGVAYGLGPRAAQFARPLLENLQNRISRNEPAADEPAADVPIPFTQDEWLYWETLERVLQEKYPTEEQLKVLRSIRGMFKDWAIYHQNHPEMMRSIQERVGRGLKVKGGGVTDYLKDKAHQAHKYITSEDGKTLGKTALTALLLAAISKGVTDAASYEIYEYADKPNRERGMYNKYRENKSIRSAAKYANEHRKEDGYFNNPDIRL